jgi:hypothetical protein
MGNVASEIMSAIVAYRNCVSNGNMDWLKKHRERVHSLVRFVGWSVCNESTTDNKLVLTRSMGVYDDYGFRLGFRQLRAQVTPAFNGINVRLQRTGGPRWRYVGEREEVEESLAEILQSPAP